MIKKKLYYKLVRDRIPEIITEAGKEHQVHQVTGARLIDCALRKLQEEVMEFVEDPCAEEAADIREILDFICERQGIREPTIKAARICKRATRGSFDMGFFLEWVEEE
jgi:predicted house-cleaning noncanonical NTP pyrophosphatase (MazG superfamily)